MKDKIQDVKTPSQSGSRSGLGKTVEIVDATAGWEWVHTTLRAPNGRVVLSTKYIKVEDAERILNALNSHPALVAALEATVNVMEIQENRDEGSFHLHVDQFRPMWDNAKAGARAALSLAKGEK